MLMEAMLIKSLFSKPEHPFSIGEYKCPEPAPCSTASAYQIGAATWSRQGEWIEEGTSKKLRLILTEDPQAFIAMRDDSTHKGWYESIRDQLTHISVQGQTADGSADSVSLNIGSLSKRTQLSVAMIFLIWITGRLTLDYVEQSVRKAQQNNRIFDQIILNGRARAVELGQDPDEKTTELREVMHTVLKSRRLAKGVLAQRGETTYIAHRDAHNSFTLEEKKDLLGKGAHGFVFEVLNLATGETEALKIAKQAEKKTGIKNENAILSFFHRNGHVEGIQDAPYFVIDLLNPELGLGYVTRKFDFSLNDLDFLKLTPAMEKLHASKSLFNGLCYIHANNYVHCDIKPANCCSNDGELQLADFGHARSFEEVTPEQPLGVCTKFFTSSSDQRKSKKITLAYCMHQIASGNVKNAIAKAWIIQTAIEHPSFDIDRTAAKFTIASLLLKISDEKLAALDIATDLYKTEMDILRNNPAEIKTRQLDIASFKLSKTEMEQLKQASFALCQGHDVYGLGVTLVCILTGNPSIAPSSLAAALANLSKNPEFAAVNPDLTKLLRQMLNKDCSKRPTAKEAMDSFNALLEKCLNVQDVA